MEDRPRPTRPTPRTPAAIEAELRRRLRKELHEARNAAADAGEELDDPTLAAIIARAIALGLSLHAEAEHVRGPQTSNAGWRGAPGPRGNRPPPRPREYEPDFEPGGPPRYGPRPPFRPRGQRPPPSRGGGFGPRKPRPR